MSLGRHAYRHAINPSSHGLLDHIWVSEDLLAASFRRFANSQRRYESRVPGPLEARRRLAKRRNTALAGGMGFGPPDDIACLFGRNGREHMKWSGDGQARRAPMESGVSDFYSLGSNATQIPFYDENVESSRWPAGSQRTDDFSSQEKEFRNEVMSCESLEDAWDLVRHFGVDVQRQPMYSRLVLDHLLSLSATDKSALGEAMMFFDDPFLNMHGAGNYLRAVQQICRWETGQPMPRILLRTISRALELGKIPSMELSDILKELSGILFTSVNAQKQNVTLLLDIYKTMWRAIGRCDVYGYNDLSEEAIDTWLEILSEMPTHDALILAQEIILSTRTKSPTSSWVPIFIERWLESPQGSRFRPKGDYASSLLQKLSPEIASSHIISITDRLLSSDQHHTLERWQHCLRRLRNAGSIVCASAWLDVHSQAFSTTQSSTFRPQRQILIRLWALRTLSQSLPQGPLWRPDQRATDMPVWQLLTAYESACGVKTEGDLIINLMTDIHALGMPYNGLLMLAVELKAKRNLTSASRAMLGSLETSKVSFADTFADLDAYNSMISRCFSEYEKMVRQIDITSPTFIEQSIHLARTGDSKRIWTLIRILRSHTPLKIALAMSWQPIPDPSEKALVRYYPDPRSADNPDPHSALEMIHLLAISISCSKNLSPPRAYALVHWLYAFLLRHNAPIRPAIVRAMYHAGVARCRREGYKISPTKYDFITAAVKRFEGSEVAAIVMEPPQVGRSHSGKED